MGVLTRAVVRFLVDDDWPFAVELGPVSTPPDACLVAEARSQIDCPGPEAARPCACPDAARSLSWRA